jgi:F0F1-type ATP synthase delta subunit
MLSQRLAQLVFRGRISTESLFVYLETHGLLALLPNILRSVASLYRRDLLRNTLVIESPFELSKHSIDTIQNITGIAQSGKRVHMELQTNTDLLAGFVACFQDKEYDASARTIIKNFIAK